MIADADAKEQKVILESYSCIWQFGRATVRNNAPAGPVLSIERIHIMMVIVGSDGEEIQAITESDCRVGQFGGSTAW